MEMTIVKNKCTPPKIKQHGVNTFEFLQFFCFPEVDENHTFLEKNKNDLMCFPGKHTFRY